MLEVIRGDLELLVRLTAAGLLSGIIGWEREQAGKRAGLRTHIVVGISAALFVAVSQISSLEMQGPEGSLRVEPLQMIQAIAVGIGFLGTGIITAGREEGSGLTTAASICGTAAVGIAAAFQHYVLALGATLLFLAVLRGLERFEDRDAPQKK